MIARSSISFRARSNCHSVRLVCRSAPGTSCPVFHFDRPSGGLGESLLAGSLLRPEGRDGKLLGRSPLAYGGGDESLLAGPLLSKDEREPDLFADSFAVGNAIGVNVLPVSVGRATSVVVGSVTLRTRAGGGGGNRPAAIFAL